MAQYFADTGVGERYDQYRPKVHSALFDILKRHLPVENFSRVVDVACGTGDSTLALLDIGRDVLGIDSSEEMLAIAKRRGLTVRQADYTELPQHGHFDLISTCMAFHWFDGSMVRGLWMPIKLPLTLGPCGLSIILPSRVTPRPLGSTNGSRGSI
ncbi:class I SAM-dependent DNA methyltransferase [Vreelandella sp. GE22]